MPVWLASGASSHSLGEFAYPVAVWVVIFVCFSYRGMVEHVEKAHGAHVRLNCQVMGPHGMCSWSCCSYMYCMRLHLAEYHFLENTGRGEFPTAHVFITSTDDPLPKGVS